MPHEDLTSTLQDPCWHSGASVTNSGESKFLTLTDKLMSGRFSEKSFLKKWWELLCSFQAPHLVLRLPTSSSRVYPSELLWHLYPCLFCNPPDLDWVTLPMYSPAWTRLSALQGSSKLQPGFSLPTSQPIGLFHSISNLSTPALERKAHPVY